PLAAAAVGFAVLAATMGAMILLDKWEPFLGLGKLAELVKQKLIRGGFPADAPNAVAVGMGPGEKVRLFDYLPFWEVGSLSVNGERLTYIGDNARFSIERAHLTSIEWKTTMPRWWPNTIAIVRWRNPETGGEGAFYVGLLKQQSLGELFRPPVELDRLLETWRRGDAPGFEAPDLDASGDPEFGEITCQTPREFASAKNFTILMIHTAVAALAISYLFDFPLAATLGD
ncbi:MAG: hypothetical protein GY953_44950, partial [bacterium]|nr:hypothetical protein [bacterium]